MPPLARNVLAVVAGAVCAFAVVVLTDLLAAQLYPLPHGLDTSDREAARAAVASVPTGVLLVVVSGWALAAGIGAFCAVRASATRTPTPGLIVAAILLLATIANLAMIPHPAWMWPAAVVLIPVLGWLGVRRGVATARPRQSAAVVTQP
jgi:hypothetical protein